MNLKTRWQRFDRREQKLLLAGGMVMVIYLLWMLLLQPLQRLVDSQQQRLENSRQLLVEVRQLAGEYRALQQAAKRGGSVNLSQLVDRSLRQNQLKMSGFQPGADGRVTVRFEQARFDDLMQWLYQLETEHQIALDGLDLRPRQTVGQVTATIRLRQNG